MPLLSLRQDPVDESDGTRFFLATADGLPVLSADKQRIDPVRGIRQWKIGVSVCSGCRVGCVYCSTRQYDRFRPLTAAEIVAQAELIISRDGNSAADHDELKFCFKQMGDPLLNQRSVLSAIGTLHARYPTARFVVSTAGPRIPGPLFNGLDEFQRNGAEIRLQFSCHTTSDAERIRLSPQLPMLTFAEIATITNRWCGESVTLNLLLLAGYTYDVGELRRRFDPAKVFIKLNHLDQSRITERSGLRDMANGRVNSIETAVGNAGFGFAHRFRY